MIHRRLPPAARTLAAAAACAAAATFGACAGKEGSSADPTAGQRFAIAENDVPFYEYGPAQAGGPDMKLSRGQEITMVRRGFGYSRVTTDTGRTGYVPTEKINPQPLPPPAPVSQTYRSMPGPGPLSPAAPQEPMLPAPEPPPPDFDPVTTFRY